MKKKIILSFLVSLHFMSFLRMAVVGHHRYHRDTKNIPTLEDRWKVATKRELERTMNDINYPNQISLTKPNTSHGYNLRYKPGSVAISRERKDIITPF